MTQQNSLGVINHEEPSNRRTDYLYRISLKDFEKSDNETGLSNALYSEKLIDKIAVL